MIICGYPCTGKSTAAKRDVRMIDLESSYFKQDGMHQSGWERNYCEFAIHLHKQGYLVFTSTHKEVIKYFENCDIDPENIFVLYPSLELKELFIQRAFGRWRDTMLTKDNLAMQRIVLHYDDDIKALQKCGLSQIVINDLCYDLHHWLKKKLLNNLSTL